MNDHLVTADEDCTLCVIIQKMQFELIQVITEYILRWRWLKTI